MNQEENTNEIDEENPDIEWLEKVNENEWKVESFGSVIFRIIDWLYQEVKPELDKDDEHKPPKLFSQKLEDRLLFKIQEVVVEDPQGNEELIFSIPRVKTHPNTRKIKDDTNSRK